MSMVGLFLIALGTGGIKPCVAAFGGDQFEDHQVGNASGAAILESVSTDLGHYCSVYLILESVSTDLGLYSSVDSILESVSTNLGLYGSLDSILESVSTDLG